MRFGDQISKKRNSDLCGSSLFALKEQVLKEKASIESQVSNIFISNDFPQSGDENGGDTVKPTRESS
jgi:hypothetical protein